MGLNQLINSWNTSNVTYMQSMFQENPAFNQPLGNWDVSGVVSIEWMTHMFHDATTFGQDLSTWCVTKITQEPYEFSLNSPLTDAHKPVWGTCPNG